MLTSYRFCSTHFRHVLFFLYSSSFRLLSFSLYLFHSHILLNITVLNMLYYVLLCFALLCSVLFFSLFFSFVVNIHCIYTYLFSYVSFPFFSFSFHLRWCLTSIQLAWTYSTYQQKLQHQSNHSVNQIKCYL